MFKNAKNPQMMLNQMMQSNPQVQKIMQDNQSLIQANGGDAEKAFRAKAAQMGIDPDEFIASFR